MGYRPDRCEQCGKEAHYSGTYKTRDEQGNVRHRWKVVQCDDGHLTYIPND